MTEDKSLEETVRLCNEVFSDLSNFVAQHPEDHETINAKRRTIARLTDQIDELCYKKPIWIIYKGKKIIGYSYGSYKITRDVTKETDSSGKVTNFIPSPETFIRIEDYELSEEVKEGWSSCNDFSLDLIQDSGKAYEKKYEQLVLTSSSPTELVFMKYTKV